MKAFHLTLALFVAVSGAEVAAADPWKDESGHGRWMEHYGRDDEHREGLFERLRRRERHAYKEEYWEGGCKVERKWDEDGYEEEVKCKHDARPPAYYHGY